VCAERGDVASVAAVANEGDFLMHSVFLNNPDTLPELVDLVGGEGIVPNVRRLSQPHYITLAGLTPGITGDPRPSAALPAGPQCRPRSHGLGHERSGRV
jgi:hypothetical protein